MCWTKVQGYIVILLSLLCLSPTTGVTLFEYGPGAGDLELPPPIDMNSALFVDFSKLDLPYDGDFFRNITVSTNFILTSCGRGSLLLAGAKTMSQMSFGNITIS